MYMLLAGEIVFLVYSVFYLPWMLLYLFKLVQDKQMKVKLLDAIGMFGYLA